MKKVLITGTDGYIGKKFEEWNLKSDSNIEIKFLDLKNDTWKQKDLSGFDSILHLAGIVHKKKTSREVYFEVNKYMTVELAEKAKKSGVKQFVFFSTMSIFGVDSGEINKNTIPSPKNFYGISKYEAEIELEKLKNPDFKIAIIRPPMVYGPNAPGNYKILSYVARRCLLFVPYVSNKRSMIHSDNLSKFINYIIFNNLNGYFHPQDREYITTSELIYKIRKENHQKVLFIKIPKKLHRIFRKSKLYNKIFGDLVYSKEMSSI